nr:hypothetical chloroplast RF1 [Papaver radicatum subsp. laestadianum]
MIFKSFLLGNLLSLCMKIINSVVVVGLYYGFLTTFSIGPSYLFLLRARVMEEGTEKEVAATTGFITGQLMMFISIYYAPLHLALGRPHTITVLVLPYLLFHFFWNNHNHKNVFDYGSTTRNSMRNLSIQCVFLNNLIFQLFNHFILPSSTLARLVNIYMFRCNNKMLFVTSSFVGWLIGHILFMKWVGLVLFWIRKNNYIRSNKYLMSELRNYMARIFSILLFVTCVYYLGRIPSPIVTKKLQETAEMEERGESEEETISETQGTKQEQEGSIEEDPSPSLCSEEKEDPDKMDETEEIQVNGKEKAKEKFHFKETCYKNSPVYETTYLDGNQENSKLEILKLKEDKDLLWFEKPLVTLLFDYKRWNRPLRYIKNDQFEDAVRDEMSQYFFFTCESDGKERISFTYPASLSIFLEMIKGKILLSTMEKPSSEELYNRWVYTNKKKKKNINNAFFNRIDALERGSLKLDVLEKRIRLCNDETEQECLPEGYDPFLSGTYRGSGKSKKRYLHPSLNMNESFSVEDWIWINKLHNILPTNYQGFDEKKEKLEEKSLLPKEGNLNSENGIKYLFDVVTPDRNHQKIIKEAIGIKEICKEVPQWSYKLITSLEQQDGEIEEETAEDHEIRSRKANHVVIFTDTERTNSTTNTNDEVEEVFVLRYSQESDFRRDIIKGSMRAQRRKTVIWEPFQTNIHSPLFLDRIYKKVLFSADTSRIMNLLFRHWMIKSTELKNSDFGEEAKEKDQKRKKKGEENDRLAVAESWDTVLFGQSIRGCLLIAHSTFRKYIGLPSLIIAKNFSRILLFQPPEWNEDWREWSREMHVKCTYNGVQLSEMEFPKNWLTEGIQIKILYPFYPKPWNSSKQRSYHRNPRGTKENSCFLTVWGMETEFPFGSPRRRPSFLKPFFKELENQIRKKKTQSFLGLRVLKEKTKGFLKDSKEKESWTHTHKKDFFLKENKIVHESSSRINWTNYSLTEKKTEDLADRTSRIKNKIEKIITDKKKTFLIPDRNINPTDISCNDKRLEEPKNIWQIFQRRSARLIRKRHSFFHFFIEKIYMDTLLFLINIPRINIQFSLDLKRKKGGIDKKSYNTEIKKEGVEEKKRMHFISTKKSSLSNISNKKLHHFCDLFDLSQAYVFYKLSQTQAINKYHMRSVLQYHGTSFFLKDRIKDFFETQGILYSESRHKNLSSFEMNGWKNWLNGHYNYQYNFSKIPSSQLVLQKRRNGINQSHTISNKASTKLDSYEKKFFSHYEKQNAYIMDSLSSKNKIYKKQYEYDLLSQKYINYREGKDSYISLSPFQVKGSLKIPHQYNTNKPPIFYMPAGIYMSHSLREDCIVDTDKNMDRKYFDWRIVSFCLRKKIDIEAWANMDTETRMNKNTKTGTSYYSISNQIDTKDLSYLAIDKQIKPSSGKNFFFDWMGMNEEILNRPISNLQLWFFPELLGLYDAYRIKPWIIPTKSLLFHFNGNQTTSEKKQDLDLELENQNQEEKEESAQENLGSDLSNQEKEVKEDYGDSYIKKSRNQNKWKSTTEAELDFFLKRYFLFQLRWHGSLDQRIINSIQIYCLLLRLNNPKQIAISSIQRGEMRLDILLIQKDLNLTELINKGVLIIEPVRLSIQGDGLFIMYQTIAISLVHKSNHQTNRKKKKKENGYNNSFDESIKRHRHERLLEKRNEKNYAFIVPENILAPRCRRELRIQICLNSEKINVLDRNKPFYKKNNIKNCGTFLDESKHLDKDPKNLDRNKGLKMKFFLWPNYRLEDLACMNRYWFDTSNGSRFSMSRIYMYPRFTIN